MTDASPDRKPQKFWLLAPLVLLALAAVAWSAAWVWLSRETAARMDAAQAALRSNGYQLTWASRRVSGYPFRLAVSLTDARFSSPTGRGVSATQVEAEALAYRPTRWVMELPAGLTLERPLTGPTKVEGELIRGSLVMTDRGPRFGIEGRALRFTPAGGAILFPLASAGRFEFDYQPRPSGPDEAGLLIRIDDAVAAQGTLLQRIGVDPKGRLLWEAVLSEATHLRGPDWGAAVRNWTTAGGAMRVVQGDAAVGDAAVRVEQGRLTVGGDGRLRGDLALAVKEAPRSLLTLGAAPIVDDEAAGRAAAVAEARQADAPAAPPATPSAAPAQKPATGPVAQLRLVFEAGVVTVGPVALAPAPKIY